MNRLFILFVVLIVGCSVPAFGNICETDAQLTLRYGAALGQDRYAIDGFLTKYYSHDGFWIEAIFLNGICQGESIRKESMGKMSDEEIRALLEMNRLGGKWRRIYDGADNQRWILDSTAAVANYFKPTNALVLSTKELMRYVAERGVVKGLDFDLKRINW